MSKYGEYAHEKRVKTVNGAERMISLRRSSLSVASLWADDVSKLI